MSQNFQTFDLQVTKLVLTWANAGHPLQILSSSHIPKLCLHAVCASNVCIFCLLVWNHHSTSPNTVYAKKKKPWKTPPRSAQNLFFGPMEPLCPCGGSLSPCFVMSSGPVLLSSTLIFINIALICRNWVIGSSRWFSVFALFPPVSLLLNSVSVRLPLCNGISGGAQKGEDKCRKKREKNRDWKEGRERSCIREGGREKERQSDRDSGDVTDTLSRSGTKLWCHLHWIRPTGPIAFRDTPPFSTATGK